MKPTLHIALGLMIWICGSFSAAFAVTWSDTITWKPVEIHNAGDETQEYLLEFNRWAYADLYYQIDEGEILHKRSGRLVPWKERDYAFDGHVLFKIQLKPGQILRGKVKLKMVPMWDLLPLISRPGSALDTNWKPNSGNSIPSTWWYWAS